MVPYALANFFAAVIVGTACISYLENGVLPGKKFSDVASASRDPDVFHAVADPKRRMSSLQMQIVDGKPMFKPKHPERERRSPFREDLEKGLGGEGRTEPVVFKKNFF